MTPSELDHGILHEVMPQRLKNLGFIVYVLKM
jgi:hypothetical protein